ncbi:amidase [Sinomonas sp. JGH33]|uniref:Amidase n=1 Tax=Sinomonas terricola TaxID=3110330 RepID=A0ABU5T1Y0_9MICC|nr:amidase [Sinomonas sp. JGH33]MEA5453509.1 amidase [Sinomonas sp. JGH33]
MTDPADLTLSEASALVAARELSSAELVQATLRRLDATEPSVHAYAHRFDEAALAAARAADSAPRRGPLHGLPFAVKDTLFTRGTPTEAGSRSLAGSIGTFDATAVDRLRAAGAILLGKHVTHEFAQGQEEAVTRNPWARERFAGGSSAGSGASVAVGSSMLSVATDAGGSTRMPAALTGVVGLKPTYGRISTYGTVPGAAVAGAEHIGLVTRSAADLDLVLPVVSGADPHDARTADQPAYRPSPARGAAGRRIGVIRRVGAGQRVEGAVDEGFERTLGALRGLGATPVELELDLSLASPAAALLVGAAASAPHLAALRQGGDGIRREVRLHLAAGLLVPAQFVHAARSVRTLLRRQVAAAFRAHRLDALATPTLPCVPPLLADFDPATDMGALTDFVSPWNLTGQPAVSVPAGLSPEGLPLAVQFVGVPFGEADLVALASAFEAVMAQSRPAPLAERVP